MNRHWWLNECNTGWSNSLERFFLRLVKLQVPAIPLAVVFAPVHGGFCIFSLFLQEWYFPHVPHFCSQLPPTGSTCVKAFCSVQEILPEYLPLSETQPFTTHPDVIFGWKTMQKCFYLKKKEKKRSSEDKFLVSIWAEECQSNEQVGWKCSFWCKSTNPWLSELKISWQEWNVVSLLFQYIKLKFKIMNSKLFRPNVHKKSDK